MEMSRLQNNKPRGFTVMETMIAIVILSVGMLSLAGLMSKMTGSTEQSRYTSMAALLASEKLEDLNRLPASDPEIAVTSGTTAGSLTSDVGNQSVTVGASTELVDYYDTVMISSGNGSIGEIDLGKDASGTVTYNTITHQPDGTVVSTSTTTAPAIPADTIQFKRRWAIEKDTPVTGVRRITVAVSLQSTVGPPINFQMSMVRP